MRTEDKFLVTNIRRYLGSDNPKLGEDRLIQQISEFSCPKNPDVEHFLKKNAVEFTKKPVSYISCIFIKQHEVSGIFYHSIETIDRKR